MTIGLIFALAGTVMVFVLTAQVATYSQPQGSRRRDEGILREMIVGLSSALRCLRSSFCLSFCSSAN
ncbi:hypothetical protein GGP80_000402 [Salinibacter ruber]|jgi:hypothetical protein|uniref:Uncharacterized protein n=1 Tax=Salinibacter ruber TaxID=146919 RepID=A0A9X2Q4S1_9BACT|nr:hypothetical protein [Salinibacter ruber]MCS3613269.1 hypothetical protein [Salinibacter ruber]MCS3616664.1 hypothetical protein [Salinibacter ruber]MCS3661517.1 hypothetical protein [Salinibacter ruber]MCS3675684.1 hypothetical protein [Salinibacter ruber]